VNPTEIFYVGVRRFLKSFGKALHFLLELIEIFLFSCIFLLQHFDFGKQYVPQNHADFITVLTKNSQVIIFLQVQITLFQVFLFIIVL